MRTRTRPLSVMLAIGMAATLSATGCGKDEASPTDKACGRLTTIDRRVSQGEASLPVLREEFSKAWTDAAQDPQSPIADPIDRVIGILDANTTGYLLPADQQHLVNQLTQIVQTCSSRS